MEHSNGDIMLGPTEEESQCIDKFCNSWVETKQQQEIIKELKKELNEKKKHLTEELIKYFKDVGSTCIPIHVQQKNLYLRLMNTIGKKQISEKTLKEAFEKITPEIFVEAAEELKRTLKYTPTILEVLCEVIVKVVKLTCSYKKEYVTISQSRERAKGPQPKKRKIESKGKTENGNEDSSKIEIILPSEVKKVTLKFYRVTEKLKTQNVLAKQKAIEMRQLTKASHYQRVILPSTTEGEQKLDDTQSNKKGCSKKEEPPIQEQTTVLSQYLNRVNCDKKSAKVSMIEENQEMPYYLKEKEHLTTPQFKVNDLKPTVEKVALVLFETADVDPKITYSSERIPDLLDKVLLENFLKNLVSAIYERRRELAVVNKSITLDKVSDRKRKVGETVTTSHNFLDGILSDSDGED